uniref:NADH-ubiquinone oxidoreductase chain 3 n=1 Tax=Columbicola passerinae TaxID=128994 RepID=A0A6G8QS13_9NEOP|nr:NADH dehydrogenase subunit 3 [Columbicola passerinae]
MSVFLLISFLISSILWAVSSLFSIDEESTSANYSFECGMDCISPNRIPFCMHFFVISVLFLVFDIELLVSLPLSWISSNWIHWILTVSVFMFILFVGLIVEIYFGSLDWDTKIFK